MKIIVFDSGIKQPKDKKIFLKDIIENGEGYIKNHGEIIPKNDKSQCIDANYWKGIDNHGQRTGIITGGEIRGRNPENPKSRVAGLPTKQMLEINETGKSNALTSVSKDSIVCYGENYIQYDVNKTGNNSQYSRIFYKDNKSNCLNVSHSSIPSLKEDETETEILWRKLTPIECERLQTVPDNYTNHVSNSQRYKMLGNGWTVDVIAHIFKNIKELS